MLSNLIGTRAKDTNLAVCVLYITSTFRSIHRWAPDLERSAGLSISMGRGGLYECIYIWFINYYQRALNVYTNVV